MLKRLRLKFICINMSIVVITVCVLFGILIHTTSQKLKEDSLRMMQTADAPEPPNGKGDKGRQRPLTFTLEMDEAGTLQAKGSNVIDFHDEALLQELYSIAQESEEHTDIIWKHELRFLQPRGSSQKVVFCDISTQIDIMRNLTLTCLMSGSLALVVFLFISIFLARWSIKPVERAWKQQKQFVADASHELKTPLTVITTNAEMLQERCPQGPEAQYAEHILTMSRQMRGLTESLLDLAQLDNGSSQQSFTDLDLSHLVEESILPFEVIFFEKELSFLSQLEEGIQVRGSSTSLRYLMEILLDNAQKYAQAQTEVLVELKRSGYSHCLISVQTHGESLSKEQLSRILERFYRCDAARPMNHSYGLGLSIAQSIVQEHRGKIWAQSKNGINTFFVQLPTV